MNPKLARRARPQVLVIYKKSTFQVYAAERKHPGVLALLKRNHKTVSTLKRAHHDHITTLEQARRTLDKLGADAVFRYRKDQGSTSAFDLIVTLGGDGTLLWASHIVGKDQPMVAINTAPRDSVGFFCAGTKDNLEEILADALRGKMRATELTRMRVDIGREVLSTRVLNDALFCHECPAATSRYLLNFHGREEDHKSSGIWVGPAAGSTAAQRSAGGVVMPPASKRLQFVVREPYLPRGARHRLLHGFVGPSEKLEITSKMPAGRLYLDGPHVARRITIGSTITMRRSDESLMLLGFRRGGG